jgi:subtilisin family serine protease
VSFLDAPQWGDPSGHGSHVAGIIVGSNVGVAPDTELVSLQVANARGAVESHAVFRALGRISMDMQQRPRMKVVINLSFTTSKPHLHCQNKIVQSIRELRLMGAAIVTAAGNHMANACHVWPSCSPDAITVAAIDDNLMLWQYHRDGTNWGTCVNIAAPGSHIGSTRNGHDGYSIKSGTSFASPFVAGAMAVMLSRGFNGEQARQWILSNGVRNRIRNAHGRIPNLIVSLPVAPWDPPY